ncbi:MAG: N-acetyltransferase [Cyanobacteria bacterium P01_F01_bin.4]
MKTVQLHDYSIRPYTSADETQWVHCRVLAFLDSTYFDDVHRTKDRYNNPSIELVAIARDGTLTGFIDIECEERPGSICSAQPWLGGMIWNIGVHPDHRLRGIARALLDRAVAILLRRGFANAKQRSLVRLEAWTRDDPHVVAWYLDQGFHRIERYLHVYLTKTETQANLTSLNPNLTPVHVFAHCTQPDAFTEVCRQFQRVHDCQLFELSLD